jgi:modulator of FtsH protease
MTDAWANFFVAQVGASAALLGLLFVGVSLNLDKILSYPVLPDRALLAMLMLLSILLVASILLIPNQPLTAIAIEVLLIGVLIWGSGTFIYVRDLRQIKPEGKVTFTGNFALFEFATLPYLVAGILLLVAAPDAFYWLAAAIILSALKALTDAWVLLVEINR